MTSHEKMEFLKSKGWHRTEHPSGWVNPKVVSNPDFQDYTAYPMALDDAYAFEAKHLPPVKRVSPFPLIDIIFHMMTHTSQKGE